MPRSFVQIVSLPLLILTIFAAASCSGNDSNNATTPSPSVASSATQSSSGANSNQGGGNEQTAVAGQQGASVADIAERVGTSVVRVGVNCQPDAPSDCEGTGSGWLYDDQGHFITNNHVVTLDGQISNPRTVTITTVEGRVEEARVVGRDPQTDLAVLEGDPLQMEPLQLGSVEETRIGEPVIAIGYALDLGSSPSVTTGVVSAKERAILDPTTQIYGLLQTDAAINPGNSGGPLLDYGGRVLGVNTATIQGAQGIGFAISADTVNAVAEEILAKGFVDRGFIGVGFQEVTPGLAESLGLPVKQGVRIEQVVPNSPAATAGLEVGDVVVKVGGADIRFTSDLTLALLKDSPGQQVEVEYYRGKDQHTAQVRLAEPPPIP